jgi:hypothetical protein
MLKAGFWAPMSDKPLHRKKAIITFLLGTEKEKSLPKIEVLAKTKANPVKNTMLSK